MKLQLTGFLPSKKSQKDRYIKRYVKTKWYGQTYHQPVKITEKDGVWTMKTIDRR